LGEIGARICAGHSYYDILTRLALNLHIPELAHIEEAADPDLAGRQAHVDSAQRWRRLAIYEQLDLPGMPVVDHPHFVPLLFGQGSGSLRRADTRTIAAIDMEDAVMRLVVRVVV